MRYCGRDFAESELCLIRQLIEEDSSRTRAHLSRLVCEKLLWYKADGGLKDMSCRVAMLRMQGDQLIQLPPPRNKRPDVCIALTTKTDSRKIIDQPVHLLGALVLQRITDRKYSQLWNEYIQRYHYLGYTPLSGAQLRYFVYCDNQIVACLGFGASAWKCAPRDNFIGWSTEQRQKKWHLIINNVRFLILPWIQSKNLASKILSIIAKQIPQDWFERYNYRPVLLETFVQKNRFSGTCYKASNWIRLGQTQGRGKLGGHGVRVPIKDLWIYPLDRHFKRQLTLQL